MARERRRCPMARDNGIDLETESQLHRIVILVFFFLTMMVGGGMHNRNAKVCLPLHVTSNDLVCYYIGERTPQKNIK